MHILENDVLKISVADAGAELCSVVDKTDGTVIRIAIISIDLFIYCVSVIRALFAVRRD